VVRLGSRSPLAEVLAAHSWEIADAVASAVGRQVTPSSAWLTAAHEHRPLLRAQMIKRALELATSSEPFSDDDLESYRELGTLFARHRVPLPLLIASFDIGVTAMIRELWHVAPAEHFAEMSRMTGRAAPMVEQSRQAATRGYLEALTGSAGRSARWVVAQALIRGESAPAAARALDEQLAPSYLVLACAVADPGHADARQMAAIERHIESLPGALHCGDLSTLIVLLPAEDSRRPPEAAAAELASRLQSLTGQVVRAACAHQPDLEQIPAALEEALRALALVNAIPDADCRPYRTDMLLVELAIAREPDIRQRLSALLTPLADGPDLHRTLEVLFACNLDRERTAKELCIHRRTLRYRMDRIRHLTGIDLDSAHGMQLLRAALVATRLSP
jgi:sugar diacid utilization regulator